MAELAKFQTRMAEALFSGRYDGLEAQVRVGPIPAGEAFGLHRNTALQGLVNALRLTYPTVDALVGEKFFHQAALAFVQGHPPASPWLTGYGSDFAAFLASYALAADLAYLPDVARLDALIEAVACQSLEKDGLTLDLGVAVLTLDASLRVVEFNYPAAAIRAAIENKDDAALGAIDMTPRRHVLALWRAPAGAALRPLSAFAATFVQALMDDGDIETVLAGRDLAVLQSEIFAAPFTRLDLTEGPKP